MAGWHHRLNGHGFGWTPGAGDGQGGLAGHCRKDSDLTAKINELMDELTKDGTLPALATKYNLNLAE